MSFNAFAEKNEDFGKKIAKDDKKIKKLMNKLGLAKK